MIKRINSIEISNVKGILNSVFNVDLIPNKPTLVVAPNGFGKSSIATAFASLNSRRLDLQKENCHRGNEARAPSLKINYTLHDGSSIEKEANALENQLSGIFDIHVINSQLVPKAKKLKISGSTVVTSAIEVQPVILITNVPAAAKFVYSFSKAKFEFGTNGKILPNISGLLENHVLMAQIWGGVDFSKHGQVGVSKIIDAFKNGLNGAAGVVSDLLANVNAGELQAVLSVPHVEAIYDRIKRSGSTLSSDVERCLAALQVTDIYAADKTAFKKAGEHAAYQAEKAAYEQTFSSLKATWKNIAPKEKKGQLLIEFPKANEISNGERDIISFVAQLKKAKIRFRKDKCILIIDEIFDYLDDANLVACQYYLTEMIGELKAEGRQIFPLIMTHLSPAFFRNFTFSGQKVCYLSKSTPKDKTVEKLIINRDNSLIASWVSSHFVHFHPDEKDLSKEFAALGLPAALQTSSLFASHCQKHLERYFCDESYDPLAVCCAVRRKIEELIYHSLAATTQVTFLSTHKTTSKLEFAQSNGINVPDAYFLLGVIYNDALHLRENQDNFSTLGSKLSNLTIKHMIASL